MLELIQPSELQIAILAIALTPVMAWAYRGVDRAGKWWLSAAITSIGVSYVTTILEGYWAEEIFNHLEHLSIAVAGACFLGFSLVVLGWHRDSAEGPRA